MSARRPGQQPVRRMAARRTASLVAASQPEMDTQVGDMEGPQVAGSSVRTAVLDNLWLADLTQMQATYAQCPEGRPGWFQSVCWADAQLNTWRCSHRTARVITSARSGKLCAMDLQSDQKMGSISAHMHSCMHCGRAQSDTMVAAVHRMLQCAAMASNVSSRIRILVRVWTGMRPRMPWCCPFCHRVGR
jgi:hypothetical protein